MSTQEVRDNYDAVIFLVSAAIGTEPAYPLANNLARRETPKRAREMNLRDHQA